MVKEELRVAGATFFYRNYCKIDPTLKIILGDLRFNGNPAAV
jgi:hypothetical protein